MVRKITWYTEDVPEVLEWLKSVLPALTLFVGVGVYKGKVEKAATIVVFTDLSYVEALHRAQDIAERIKIQFNQESVLVEVADVNAFFV